MSGTLFYLIGASGAGKDSLLRAARTQLAGENHIALSLREFHTRQTAGLFAVSWHSHELDYGLGIEINAWLERCLTGC